MPEILQLEEFYLTRLHIDWHQPPDAKGKGRMLVQGMNAVDYDVMRRRGDARLFALKLRYTLRPTEPKAGLEIDSEIVGIFRFPKTMPEDEMQKLIRINGGMILYGILRGEIACHTGSFPGGKFVLPTVNMPDIVRRIEAAKANAGSHLKTKTAPGKKADIKRATRRR